jgi:crotonobetainyl-CoA:carnitine CoA-transferase CaiB-like acyl-CoA transferase
MTSPPVLHNIRVLDFTWVLAGPYATRLLADFGAEVIKVQPLISSEREDAFARGYYNTWNRNKLGITLNLNKPEGVDIARRLAALCDAVVENFTPRVMANWGLDYACLKEIRPDIVMLSMSMMGQTGPRRDYTGFGPTVQAASGLTYLTAFPGGPPLGPGFSYADHVAGLYASLALLGALEHRRRTGEGQHIDISQVEAMAGLMGEAFNGQPPVPVGNRSPLAAPHDVYPCADGRWCALAVFTDDAWPGFKRALGGPAWAETAKFAGAAGRQQNKDELDRLVAAWTRGNTAAEVMTRLQENGVPAGLVQDAADLDNDPQLRARGFFIEGPWPGYSFVDASPVRLSESPADYRLPAPPPGRDNDYVYGRLLSLTPGEIAAFREAGAIGSS